MRDKAPIEEFATQRAHGSPSLKAQWQQALHNFPQLPESLAKAILEVLTSPESARQLCAFVSREEDPTLAIETLFKEVDESNESLEEWMKAFEVFACFIDSTPHKPTLGMAIGYLHCCVSMAHTGSNYATFPMAVETMLETYGYEGAKD